MEWGRRGDTVLRIFLKLDLRWQLNKHIRHPLTNASV